MILNCDWIKQTTAVCFILSQCRITCQSRLTKFGSHSVAFFLILCSMYFSVSNLINESDCFSIQPTLFFIKQNDFPVTCDFLMFCRGASQGYILCHNTLYMFMLLRFVFISQCLRLNKLLIFSHKSNEKLICIFCL